MTEELVHLTLAGPVATVTLDSPTNRNALSARLLDALDRHLSAAIDDEDSRLIVLTGAGPAFCSGADLKEARGGTGPARLVSILQLILDSPKPVIARVNGPARAGGIGLLAACDVAVAVDSVSFAFSEVRIGVVPAIIAVVVIPRIGAARARSLFLTGHSFSAADAVNFGLIEAAVPGDQLDETVSRLSNSVLKAAPSALAGAKRLTRELPGMNTRDAFDLASDLSARFFGSEDAQEGMAAFADKRPPRWDITT